MKSFSEYTKSENHSIRESAPPYHTLFLKDKKELDRMIKEEIKKHGRSQPYRCVQYKKLQPFIL